MSLLATQVRIHIGDDRPDIVGEDDEWRFEPEDEGLQTLLDLHVEDYRMTSWGPPSDPQWFLHEGEHLARRWAGEIVDVVYVEIDEPDEAEDIVY